VNRGKIQVDRFKCMNWPDMIAEASRLRPVAVHFNLKAGRGKLAGKDWDQARKFLEQTKTPYINLHLESRPEDFPGMPLDTTDPGHQAQIAARMIDDLQVVIKEFGAQRVIGENVPYRSAAGKVLRPSVEPAVIQQVLAETGCGLLLDIAHARISAYYLGIDERSYMEALPVHRIREMHFTGVQTLNGHLQDHLAAIPADWQALDWVIENICSGKWPKPWMLAFEYGGIGEKFAWRSDPQVIEAQGQLLNNKLMREELSENPIGDDLTPG
jgi:uncharacterized protein (UPF0276 family)